MNNITITTINTPILNEVDLLVNNNNNNPFIIATNNEPTVDDITEEITTGLQRLFESTDFTITSLNLWLNKFVISNLISFQIHEKNPQLGKFYFQCSCQIIIVDNTNERPWKPHVPKSSINFIFNRSGWLITSYKDGKLNKYKYK